MKKLLSFLLLSLLTITTLNLSYAQVSDSDDAEELECTTLSYNMRLGSRDQSTNGDVSKLQVFLSQANYLDADPTGYYGNATRKAVRAFQQDNRLVVTGTIGAVSRAKIKSVSCTGTNNPVNPVINDPVVISPINGMLNMTYYKLNQSGDKCTSVLFIGNRGDNVVNGQFVYLSGQYKTEVECLSKISNNVTKNIQIRGVQKTGEWQDSSKGDVAGTIDEMIEIVGDNLNFIEKIKITETNRFTNSTNYPDATSLSIPRSNFVSSGNTSIKFWYRVGPGTIFTLNVTPVSFQNESIGSFSVQLGSVPQSSQFKLKAPTDIERGNVITSIKGGQYMNICWDKPANFTDQLIRLSLIDSQVKGGSNVFLGSAYLSQNCFAAIVPSNFSAGVTNVVATNADNSLYSNSSSFEVIGGSATLKTLSAVKDVSFMGPVQGGEFFVITVTGSNLSKVNFLELSLAGNKETISRSQFTFSSDNMISFKKKVETYDRLQALLAIIDASGVRNERVETVVDNSIPEPANALKAASVTLYNTKTSYKPGEIIKFSVQALDSRGQVATPEKGFNVQYHMIDNPNNINMSKTTQINGEYASGNAVFNYNTNMWDITTIAPNSNSEFGPRDLVATFYCSVKGGVGLSNLGCYSSQIDNKYSFTVN